MGSLTRYRRTTALRELCVVLLAIAWWVPFYIVFVIAIKPTSETLEAPLALPKQVDLGNVATAWQGTGGAGLGQSLVNSAVIAAGSVAALIAIGAVSAYAIARRRDRMGSALYFFFVVGLVAPTQLGIVPLYATLRYVHLLGTLGGAVLLYSGLLMPISVFLYTSFIRGLPVDYEEAAIVDGASRLQAFVHVVFSLLRPVTGTVGVLAAVIIWNDFFTQLVFFGGGTDNRTLPVAIYQFVGQYETQWNVVFAAVGIALLPVFAVYLVAQRQLIRGFTGGIKG